MRPSALPVMLTMTRRTWRIRRSGESRGCPAAICAHASSRNGSVTIARALARRNGGLDSISMTYSVRRIVHAVDLISGEIGAHVAGTVTAAAD